MASDTPLVSMESFSYRYPGAAMDALREIDLEDGRSDGMAPTR